MLIQKINMRKIKFFSALTLISAAAFGLTACSSSDEVTGDGGTKTGNEQYISVNITNAGGVGTRAAGATYADGEEFENMVSSVRFYLFDADGNPYNDSEGKNYYDPATVVMDGSKDPSMTVAAKTKAIIVIDGAKGTTPSSMVALINLTKEQKDALGTSVKLTDLINATNKITDSHVTTTSDGAVSYSNFVMSSSTSFEETTPVIAASTVGHIETSTTAAENNPVDIYVERLDAKVKTSLNATNGKWADLTYKVNTAGEIDPAGTTEKTGKACEVGTLEDGTTKVYALVTGWGVTDEQASVSIFKGFDGISGWGTSTTDNPLGFAWNDGSLHRSYWESVSAFTTGESKKNLKQLSAYNKWNLAFGSYTYTHPNTPSSTTGFDVATKNSSVSDLTKVAIAAQLVTKDDADKVKPAEISSFKSLQYESLSALKTAVITYLSNTTQYYYSDDNGTTHPKLDTDAITFAKLNDVGKSYQVSPQLATKEGRKYYTKSGDTYTEVDASTINTTLADPSYLAEVRKSGMTYYYLPIRHLAENIGKIGYYGVVRNHVYDITIDGITGFGTPVWEPSLTYDPLTPTDNASFIAARINVLQWRTVTQNADIDGGKITK